MDVSMLLEEARIDAEAMASLRQRVVTDGLGPDTAEVMRSVGRWLVAGELDEAQPGWTLLQQADAAIYRLPEAELPPQLKAELRELADEMASLLLPLVAREDADATRVLSWLQPMSRETVVVLRELAGRRPVSEATLAAVAGLARAGLDVEVDQDQQLRLAAAIARLDADRPQPRDRALVLRNAEVTSRVHAVVDGTQRPYCWLRWVAEMAE